MANINRVRSSKNAQTTRKIMIPNNKELSHSKEDSDSKSGVEIDERSKIKNKIKKRYV